MCARRLKELDRTLGYIRAVAHSAARGGRDELQRLNPFRLFDGFVAHIWTAVVHWLPTKHAAMLPSYNKCAT